MALSGRQPGDFIAFFNRFLYRFRFYLTSLIEYYRSLIQALALTLDPLSAFGTYDEVQVGGAGLLVGISITYFSYDNS